MAEGGIITAALRHLIAAGVAGDALVAAVADMEEARTPQRSSNAQRQAAYRARQKAPEDVTDNVTDVTRVTAHNGTEVSPKKQQSIPPSHSPPISPPFPVSAALAVWNEMAERTDLPKAQTATGKRQAAIRQRLAEHGEEGFRKAVAAVERSKFCRGENDRGWRADIGFMLRPDNFVKLIEGGFDQKGATPIGRADARPMNAQQIRSAIAYAEDNGNPDRVAELKQQLASLVPAQGPAAGMIADTARKLSAGARA